SPSNANELQRILSKYPERVQVLPLGMEDQSTIDALEIKIAQTCRRVDALFNVAGILGDGGMATPGPEGSVVSIDRDWLKKSLAVNIIGPVMLTKALSPLMRVSRRRARVGSMSDNRLGGWYSYRMSKSALNQATKTLGLELKRQGTWILALHSGTTDTDLSKPFQKNVQKEKLFPVEFTVNSLLDVVKSINAEHTGGFYDWAGKAIPY
ncbi:hypothetical protein HJC23_008931, partial [Cyclotella cryptica]